MIGKDGKTVNHGAEKAKDLSKYPCSGLEQSSMIYSYLTVIRTLRIRSIHWEDVKQQLSELNVFLN